MTRTVSRICLFLLPGFLAAQSWEVGGSAGYGLFHDVKVAAGSTTGSAGFAPGYAFGAYLDNQISRRVGGEIRYTYRSDDLRVTSGSTQARAGADSHAIHYDFLVHATRKESPVRPFFAAGAGMKFYRGTGAEPVFQPLSNLVVLTHASEAQPLISFGGGVKFLVSRRGIFRLDFRDYATPVPTSLLAAPPGSHIGGWIHDFVFLASIGAAF